MVDVAVAVGGWEGGVVVTVLQQLPALPERGRAVRGRTAFPGQHDVAGVETLVVVRLAAAALDVEALPDLADAAAEQPPEVVRDWARLVLVDHVHHHA